MDGSSSSTTRSGVFVRARALALDESRVFVGTASGDVFALDAA